ncbi:MAG: flagellar biosynthesis anti-sigma factor FlgM [Steroidobacteraceae bacterium]
MSNRVSGVEIRPVRTAPGAATSRKSGESPAGGSTAAEAGVDVRITGAARGLAAIEQRLRELPAIDENRVAAVRQRLEDGSYRIDAQRIADRLLHLEQDLDRGRPVDDATLK